MILVAGIKLPDLYHSIRRLEGVELGVVGVFLSFFVLPEVGPILVIDDASWNAEGSRDGGKFHKIALPADLDDGGTCCVKINIQCLAIRWEGEFFCIALHNKKARGEEQFIPFRVELFDKLLAPRFIGGKRGEEYLCSACGFAGENDLVIIRDCHEVRRMGGVDNLVFLADAAEGFVERALHLWM